MTTVDVSVVCRGRPCRTRQTGRTALKLQHLLRQRPVKCQTAPVRLQSRSKNLVGMKIVDQVEVCLTADDRRLASQRAVLVFLMQQTNAI